MGQQHSIFSSVPNVPTIVKENPNAFVHSSLIGESYWVDTNRDIPHLKNKSKENELLQKSKTEFGNEWCDEFGVIRFGDYVVLNDLKYKYASATDLIIYTNRKL